LDLVVVVASEDRRFWRQMSLFYKKVMRSLLSVVVVCHLPSFCRFYTFSFFLFVCLSLLLFFYFFVVVVVSFFFFFFLYLMLNFLD